MQLALKLVLNGSYGAFCHPAFTISNTNIANSITALAREVINYMLDHIEDYFYEKWGYDKDIHDLLGSVYITKLEDGYYLTRKDGLLIDNFPRMDDEKSTGVDKILYQYHMERSDFVDVDIESFDINGKVYETVHKCFICDFSNVEPLPTTYEIEPIPTSKKFDETKGLRTKPIVIYGDTDSLIGSSSIVYENGKCTIEELYNKSNISAGNTLKGHESVECKEKVLNYSEEKGLYYAPVKRIIRHKVTKSKWKLKTKSGKEVIVTNDHSMIVFRDGKQTEVKPSEILKSDKILCIK
jgi:DNA polymerase elongation subunit (family B)